MTPTPAPRPLPTLELPLPPLRPARTVTASVLLHAIVVAALAWRGAVGLGTSGNGARSGGPGGRDAINFFTLPASAPAAVDVEPPSVRIADLPALARIKLDVPPLDVTRDATVAAPPLQASNGVAGSAQGEGSGAGTSPGGGGGGGAAAGAGTGGSGDYIVVASPRTAILPPLAKVPGSVAGRSLRIRFWVAADGRVTRVEVDPPIREEGYRREFLERMMAYQFYPARTRDGANVASVVTVPMQLGN